ncbi:nucleotide-binding domain protein, partial [Escherichia coli 3030-1]
MDEASDQTGPGSLESLITSMSDSLNTAYKNSGHKISFVFERDPDMGKEEIEDMVAHKSAHWLIQVSSYRMWSMRKSQHCPHGWSGSVAGWRSGVDPTLSATAIAPPMMS